MGFRCDPEYIAEALVYNIRTKDIEVCHYPRIAHPEASKPCRIIKFNQNRHWLDVHLVSKLKISEWLNHIVIKDSNGVEILNLQGEALDSAFRIVQEDEYSITYRLDVN